MSNSDAHFALMDREQRRMVPGEFGKTVFATATEAKKEKKKFGESYDGSIEVVKMTPFHY